MQYSIGKLNGRYVVTWMEEGKRRRIRLSAQRKADADAEALRVWSAHQMLKEKSLTFDDLKQFYREHLGDRRTGHQVDDIWKNMGPALGHYAPDEINDRLMSEFLEMRQAEAIKRRGKKLSNGTLYADVNIAQSILNFAKKKRIISEQIHLDKPVRPAPKDRWLRKAEIDLLLSRMKVVPHLYTASLLMLSTAGRVTAVLELEWDRVNFDENYLDLRVNPNLPAKGRARVPMNAGLKEHLSAIKESAEGDFVVQFRGKKVRSIAVGFRRQCTRVGLNDVSPHVLRHTAAVHMAAAGCSLQRISQYLGHSSIHVTERIYARYAPEHLTVEADVLDFVSKPDENL